MRPTLFRPIGWVWGDKGVFLVSAQFPRTFVVAAPLWAPTFDVGCLRALLAQSQSLLACPNFVCVCMMETTISNNSNRQWVLRSAYSDSRLHRFYVWYLVYYLHYAFVVFRFSITYLLSLFLIIYAASLSFELYMILLLGCWIQISKQLL